MKNVDGPWKGSYEKFWRGIFVTKFEKILQNT